MLRPSDQKIVIVTRQTRMQALKAKFGTRGMAKFAMSRAREIELAKDGAPPPSAQEADAMFHDIELEEAGYGAAVSQVQDELDLKDLELKVQTIDRDFLPNYVFGPNDIVITLGQDGLVANTAKYALGLPIIAVNPDPSRFDGVLLPFQVGEARSAVRAVLAGKAHHRDVTLAESQLTDGQRLLAFNDLFIGVRSHVSARYRLTAGGHSEKHSSSGILVSTGAGSTGWLSSVFNMTSAIAQELGKASDRQLVPVRLEWEDPRLIYVVREPFISKTSSARLVCGFVQAGQELVIESMMPSDGIIFSDGIEADYLEFNSGMTARVRVAQKHARLVVPL